ncbi:MAG: hypothetical protein WBP03_00070 [Candidatus Saccharimonadales bacterium]
MNYRTFEQSLAARAEDPRVVLQVERLSEVISHHLASPPTVTTKINKDLALLQEHSAYPDPSLRQNRSIVELLGHHSLPLDETIKAVRGQAVIDFGAGRSDFLNHFPGSKTTAVEINRQHSDYQLRNGHEVAKSLTDLPDGSAQLIHDSYATYWLASISEAQTTAGQMKRILAPGGTLLTGSIFAGYYHGFCETALSINRAHNLPFTPPYNRTPNPANDVLSYIRLVFANEFLRDPNYRVSGVRNASKGNPTSPRSHLPNFLAVTKQV